MGANSSDADKANGTRTRTRTGSLFVKQRIGDAGPVVWGDYYFESTTTTYVISNNTGASFGGVVDTHLTETAPTTNSSASTTIDVKAWNTGDRAHTVIKFGGLSSVPAGTVSNAKLRIYCTGIGNAPFDYPTVNAYKLIRAFVDTQATWNEAATATNWGTAGATNNTNDYDATLLGSIFVGATGAWFEITGTALTAYVQAIISGGADNGLLLAEENFLTPAGQSKSGAFWSSEGTDGLRPELVFDHVAGGGGSTIVDLTVATFSFIAQAVQNKRRVLPTNPTLTMTAQSVQNRNVIKPTSPTLSFVAQSVQNSRLATLTQAALSFVAQTIRNKLVVKPTTAGLGLVAQSIQNRLLVKLTSANLNFSALAVEFVIGAGTTVVDLTVATFSFVAQEVRNVRRVVLTSPVLTTTAQTVQNRLRATLTATSLSLNAQAVTVRRVITTTTASIAFTAQSVQNKLTVKLTSAILNFQGMAVDMFNVVITVLVARARKSYSNYRRMLKQRRF